MFSIQGFLTCKFKLHFVLESANSEKIKKRIYQTRAEAKSDIFDYIEGFYNRFRRHCGLSQRLPKIFERSLQTQIYTPVYLLPSTRLEKVRVSDELGQTKLSPYKTKNYIFQARSDDWVFADIP